MSPFGLSPLMTLYFQGGKFHSYLDAHSVTPSSGAGSLMKRFYRRPPKYLFASAGIGKENGDDLVPRSQALLTL